MLDSISPPSKDIFKPVLLILVYKSSKKHFTYLVHLDNIIENSFKDCISLTVKIPAQTFKSMSHDCRNRRIYLPFLLRHQYSTHDRLGKFLQIRNNSYLFSSMIYLCSYNASCE